MWSWELRILVKLFDVNSRMDVQTSVAASWSYIYWVISGAIDVSVAVYRWNDTADRLPTSGDATSGCNRSWPCCSTYALAIALAQVTWIEFRVGEIRVEFWVENEALNIQTSFNIHERNLSHAVTKSVIAQHKIATQNLLIHWLATLHHKQGFLQVNSYICTLSHCYTIRYINFF